MDVLFDAMTQKYAKEVMDIFNYYVTHSFAAYPETPLPDQFFNRFLEVSKGYPAFVLKDATTGMVVGFCFLRAYNPFPAFRQTAEITYFLEKNQVGKGIGSQALQKLEEEAQKMGIKILLANISSENTQSISFHLKRGFQECGRFHKIGTKKGVSFDVVWMEKSLDE
jgi:L-amino acid N-acyltransferase YncA